MSVIIDNTGEEYGCLFSVPKKEPMLYLCSLYILLCTSGVSLFNNEDFTAYNLVVTGSHTVRKGYADMVISCEIDRRTTFREIHLMGLEKKNGEDEKRPVLFITDETKITWEDHYIQHRPGVTVSGDITSVQSAYLTYTISRDYVHCDNDSASYSCFLGGLEKNGSMSTQFTKDYLVKVLDPPKHMDAPVVRTGALGNPTPNRQFPAGTTIQIECSGEVGTDQADSNPSIRWCSRAVGDTSLTPMPVTHSFNARKINSCLWWKTSALEYTVSAIDEETQIICESGYQYACGSGTAKANVTIQVNE
ncbi:uncharacterized protein LOC130052958 isoform X2 [Ostrea edulis]|uniref:uncharacterized protein LOC130052958 isoform X2 n=1 Tax=Ostrea edulis TaxID=37623 RepID=UPI0024AF23EA|nr:uncharacterized protein LOC130052958 isoform X2 [Ostrea edulis]